MPERCGELPRGRPVPWDQPPRTRPASQNAIVSRLRVGGGVTVERIAEAAQDAVGLLAWAMWAADGIAATELADEDQDWRDGSAAALSTP